MKDNEKKKPEVLITEGNSPDTANASNEVFRSPVERLKKPLIFILMAIVFLGCMYLIFSPSDDDKVIQQEGLNDVVPQATNSVLPSDKGKAYEQEQLDQKTREKRNALTTLSDYWNTDSTSVKTEDKTTEKNKVSEEERERANPALSSYRNIQSSIGSFYKGNGENESLRKEVESLKKQLTEKGQTPSDPIKNQLTLMEKSYQMAAKYLPVGSKALDSIKATPGGGSEKEVFEGIQTNKKTVVSALYRKPGDSVFLAKVSQQRNREFYSSNIPKTDQIKNSIRACIQETQTVTSESSVVLRLLENAQISGKIVPAGTHLIASPKFQGGRLQLRVVSMELEGSIIPLDITVYDLDGQKGLYVPYSPEMNAATEMASKMGTATGTSFTLNSSAGQQVAADLSKGVIQGVTGYFAKKVKTPKVTVKAGHQVLLVSKK